MRAGSCRHHSVKGATGNRCYVSVGSLRLSRTRDEPGVRKGWHKTGPENSWYLSCVMLFVLGCYSCTFVKLGSHVAHSQKPKAWRWRGFARSKCCAGRHQTVWKCLSGYPFSFGERGGGQLFSSSRSEEHYNWLSKLENHIISYQWSIIM